MLSFYLFLRKILPGVAKKFVNVDPTADYTDVMDWGAQAASLSISAASRNASLGAQKVECVVFYAIG